LVIEARGQGAQFQWVGADALYGNNPTLTRMLDRMHETIMADVSKSQRIYFEDPNLVVPPAKSKRGRRPSMLKAQCVPVRGDKWAKQQPAEREKGE
jgi:hypothetical protein